MFSNFINNIFYFSNFIIICKLFLILTNKIKYFNPKLLINLNTKRLLFRFWSKLQKYFIINLNLIILLVIII